jgi:RHS repeat-associated protein
MTDPRGNTTTYSYADNYSSGSPSGPTNAYLTQITHPQTNGVNHVERFAYAFASGEVTSSTDQNNLVTSYKYNDSFARLTETDFPDGGITTVSFNDSSYNPSIPAPSVTTTKKINATTSVVTVAAMDGLGHPVRAEVTSDPQGTIYTDTSYDGLGRLYTVSNPYRSGNDPTTSSGSTAYIYDPLGRKCVEVPPDGTAVSGNICPASAPAKDLFTQYSGSTTTVTDQTGKKRQSTTDGLGRLIQVVEDPGGLGYITNYTVDVFGNLTQVVQNGSHIRTFTYDSLSRLLCSSNPENSFALCPNTATSTYTPGTIGYTYDAEGNVASKTVSTSQSSGTAGSGSSTVSGSEQSLAGAPAVSGTGSVSFSGTLQSTQVLTQPATRATGSVAINGSEQSGNFCDDSGRNCHFKYDLGVVTIYVNGASYAASYGRYDTSSTIASNLASALNSSGVVTATASGSTVNITSVATGTSANYSLSASSYTNDPTDFGFASFTPFPSGSTLTGGANAVYTTRYDSGTSTITVNGHGDTVSWSGSGTTSSSIASSLASTINADSGAYVSASAVGATVNLTAKAAGASTDYSLSSSYTYDTTDFASSSFTSSNSGGTLTGGRDAGATIYDSGSVWITLNGTQYSASYGQSSSSSSLASTLASAINGGSLATAVANGSGITITANSVGTATNYSLTVGSSTNEPGSFSSPSFSISPSGGSLTGGTDAGSPIVTSYFFDALNRETLRTYSNGDASIATNYDELNCLGLSACQNIGHSTSTTDAAGSESWAYQVDPGNFRSVHVNRRTTNNVTKTTTYVLDLAGNTTQVTYPTGRIVNFTFDAANRPATASDSANGIAYATGQASPPPGCAASGVCYSPQGTEYGAAIGKTSTFNGINLSETYNNRLQPLEIKASSSGGNAFDISYSFVDPATGGNAGHVYSITNNLNGGRSQSFAYDSLNRITFAGTTATSGTYCWGYQYDYDAWANLKDQLGWSPNYNGCSEATMATVTPDGSNHISGFTYDKRGNTTNDGTIDYTFDAESQIKTAAGVTYSYDGSGRRVSKSNGKLYWYGSGGEILTETDGSGNTLNEYVFFGGKRIALLPAGGNAEFYAEDFLGSSRVMTQNNGTPCYDADFDPFGGEHAYTNNCPSTNGYKFEGKERDTETGNDDFGARYYTSRFGRWLSSDWSNTPVAVPYANLTNPQTLNLYAMVSDDPESFADLDGHCCVLEGAAEGAEIGSVAGPIGEALGAALGAGIGALAGYGAADYMLSHPNDFQYPCDAGCQVGTRPWRDSQGNLRDPVLKVDQQTKEDVKQDANGKCEYCGKTTQDAQKSQKGVTPSNDEGQTDHYKPSSKNGSDDKSNLVHACRGCNRAKGDADPTNPNDKKGQQWQLDRMKNQQPTPPPPPKPPAQPPVPQPNQPN